MSYGTLLSLCGIGKLLRILIKKAEKENALGSMCI